MNTTIFESNSYKYYQDENYNLLFESTEPKAEVNKFLSSIEKTIIMINNPILNKKHNDNLKIFLQKVQGFKKEILDKLLNVGKLKVGIRTTINKQIKMVPSFGVVTLIGDTLFDYIIDLQKVSDVDLDKYLLEFNKVIKENDEKAIEKVCEDLLSKVNYNKCINGYYYMYIQSIVRVNPSIYQEILPLVSQYLSKMMLQIFKNDFDLVGNNQSKVYMAVEYLVNRVHSTTSMETLTNILKSNKNYVDLNWSNFATLTHLPYILKEMEITSVSPQVFNMKLLTKLGHEAFFAINGTIDHLIAFIVSTNDANNIFGMKVVDKEIQDKLQQTIEQNSKNIRV